MSPKFRDRDTERFADGQHVRRLQGVPQRRAFVALDRLDAATKLFDLRAAPGNRFEALKGDRAGQYSIRINDQWHVCFEWSDDRGEAVNIEITDYHWFKHEAVNRGMTMPRPPIHPGEHLRIDLEELNMSQAALARALGVPKNRISQIINGDRGITADTALRLARWMGTTPQYWLNLQMMHDLRVAEQTSGQEIRDSVEPRSAHAA